VSLCVVESCCASCIALTVSEFRMSSCVIAGPVFLLSNVLLPIKLFSCVTSGPLDAGTVCVLATAGSVSCTRVLSAGPAVALEFCCRGPTAPDGSNDGFVVVVSVGPAVDLLALFGRPAAGPDVVNCPSSVVGNNLGTLLSVVEGVMVVSVFGSGRMVFFCPATKACQQACANTTAKTL
jgi:hypothetical protein